MCNFTGCINGMTLSTVWMAYRMDGVYNVYDTLIKAQDCIKEMRDKETTDIKYHY